MQAWFKACLQSCGWQQVPVILPWPLLELLLHMLKCLLVVQILLVIRLEYAIDFFFLIASCSSFSSKTLAFFSSFPFPASPCAALSERGTPPFNLTSVSTQQEPQSFSWLLVSHLIRHQAFMLAPCICTRYFVILPGRTKSFQLPYLLVCQTRKGRREGKGGGRDSENPLVWVICNFSPLPTPMEVLLLICTVQEDSALWPTQREFPGSLIISYSQKVDIS